MKREYDFSKGERGKFFRQGAKLKLPVYLDHEVRAYFRERADRADVDRAREILERAGKGNPPVAGDELDRAARTRRPKESD